MATVINAGTTTSTALNITTDTTGTMVIQTSGANAISISSGQVVTLANPLAAGSGGTGLSSLGANVATFLGTPSSANLLAAVTDETGTGSLVFSTSPALTGTPTAPNAANGTNTTQIATTAFVNSAVTIATGSLGTMSTQNANAVAITGGTIGGITDLAVADGGTGRSALTANNVLVGNGTSAVNFVAPSTSGFALRSDGTTWTSQRLGLGMTGESWNNVTGSRNSGQVYTNSYSYPIQVSVTQSQQFTAHSLDCFVNGVLVANMAGGGNFYLNSEYASFIVPPGATYQCNFNGAGISNWAELY
jgi:hypothetical protein